MPFRRKSRRMPRAPVRRRFTRTRRARPAARRTRRLRKRSYRIRPTVLSSRFGPGLPDVFNVKLKWSRAVNIQAPTDIMHYFYRGSHPFDPEVTALPGQTSAIEYSTFSQLYRYCRVYASKMTVVGTAVSSTDPCFMILVPCTQRFVQAYEVISANRRVRKSRFAYLAGQNNFSVSNFCTTKAIFGLKNPINDNDHDYDVDNSNTIILPPALPWHWYLQVLRAAQNTAPINVSLELQITYYCRFFERFNNQLTGLPDADDPDPVDPDWDTGTNRNEDTLTGV